MYTTLTQENWEETVIKSDKVTLVDVWAPWCGPTKFIYNLWNIQKQQIGLNILNI